MAKTLDDHFETTTPNELIDIALRMPKLQRKFRWAEDLTTNLNQVRTGAVVNARRRSSNEREAIPNEGCLYMNLYEYMYYIILYYITVYFK